MGRTAVIALVVVGLGVVVVWWMSRQGVGASPPAADDGCGDGALGSIGSFIKGHTDRKNALAPTIAGSYTGLGSSVKPITDIAGKLSPSGYAEKYIGDKVGNFLCNPPSISAIFGTVGGKIQSVGSASTTFGQEQLKAGTVKPAQDILTAGQRLYHGDVTGAGKAVVSSVVSGPKAAVQGTVNFVKSLF